MFLTIARPRGILHNFASIRRQPGQESRAIGFCNLRCKSAGAFKIDDPIDPANKYLSHSFVESPDMMNLYNGIVTLDAHGAAVITMPDWFSALNRDFRYTLTAIGAPAPKIFVAEEMKGNQFKIAGGKKGQRISWMVTGIRHDAYAEAHRIPTEEEKPADEHGKYLHPELFGAGAEQAIAPAPPTQNATTSPDAAASVGDSGTKSKGRRIGSKDRKRILPVCII